MDCDIRKLRNDHLIIHHCNCLLLAKFVICGPGSSAAIATDYGLEGPGSNSGGDEIFRLPDRLWDPPSLL